MASIQYLVRAVDNASGVFAKIAASADGLDKQLADLSKRVATPEVDLKDAKFTLGMINAAKRLDKLNAMVADPRVEVETAKAQTEILRVNAMLDRLEKTRTVKVKVDVDSSALSKLLGRLPVKADRAKGITAVPGTGLLGGLSGLPGIGGGLASLLGTGGGAGAGLGGTGVGGLGAAGGAAAGIAALLGSLYLIPHAAAAAGGGIIFALGGAMTAIGVIAAMKARGVQETFKSLSKQAGIDLSSISVPFRAVLMNIGTALKGSLPEVMLSLGIAFKAIAPALQTFGVTIARTLGDPTVQSSIRAIGVAFASLLKAITPNIPSMINSIANGITGIAQAITKNPQTFAILINFFVHLIGWGLQAVGALIRVAGWTDRFAVTIGSAVMGAWHAVDGSIHSINNAIAGFGMLVASAFDTARHAAATFGAGIASAFDSARHVFATIGHDIATAFDAVRHAFATIGHDIASAFDQVRHAQGQFDAFGKDVAAIVHAILSVLDVMRHGIAVIFDGVRHDIAAAWDAIYRDTISLLARLRHDIAADFDAVRHDVAAILAGLRHDIAAAWDAIWRDTTSIVSGGIAAVLRFFKALPGQIVGALASLGSKLKSSGSGALKDFLSGMESIAGSIFSWVGNFVSTIWNKVKKFFGMSPPHPGSLFYELGADMMRHLEAGIKAHAHKAVAAAHAAASAAGSIPGQTGPLSGSAATAQSFAASLLPRGWSFADLQALWNQESGWSAYALNPSSGAYGIPQALPSVWGHPYAMGDYKAQIVWGLNYIAGKYGSSQGAWAHEQAFNWYGLGGIINEPVLGMGRSGRLYGFGERGPETVTPGTGGGGSAITARLDKVIALLSAAPARTAAGVAGGINGGARAAARSAYYSSRP